MSTLVTRPATDLLRLHLDRIAGTAQALNAFVDVRADAAIADAARQDDQATRGILAARSAGFRSRSRAPSRSRVCDAKRAARRARVPSPPETPSSSSAFVRPARSCSARPAWPMLDEYRPPVVAKAGALWDAFFAEVALLVLHDEMGSIGVPRRRH
jgi:hypothetical protein